MNSAIQGCVFGLGISFLIVLATAILGGELFLKTDKNSQAVQTSNTVLSDKLEVYFIDVGQGDATFIVTPHNKTILIDGGGSKDFDVGKNTLLPYLLDRGYSSIDYLIPSHFDNDHIGRFTICNARNKSKKYHNRKTI